MVLALCVSVNWWLRTTLGAWLLACGRSNALSRTHLPIESFVFGCSVLFRGVRLVALVLLRVLRAGDASRHRNDDKMVLFDPS